MAASKLSNTLVIQRTSQFSDNRITSISNMQKTATLTDFSINVKGKIILCHRLVLASASPYFQALFNSDLKEAQHGEVRLDTLDARAVKGIVEYCYSGELEMNWNNVKEYLEVVEHFQLQEVKRRFDEFIAGNLKPNNCIGFYYYSDLFLLKDTNKKSQQMMLTAFQEVTSGTEFKQLTYAELVDYIQGKIDVQSNDAILKACIDWILFDIDERCSHFSDVLDHVRLENCSVDYLKHILNTYRKSLISDIEIYVRVNEVLLSNLSTSAQSPDERKSKVIILGGKTSDTWPSNKCWEIDITSGETKELATLPASAVKYYPAVCLTHVGILSAGGGTENQESSATTDCDLYETATRNWTKLPALPSPVMCAGAACVEDQVFIMGGYIGRQDVMDSFNLCSKKWSSCPKMLQKVSYPIVAMIGGCIFLLFNTSPANKRYRNGSDISLQCYNVNNSQWSFKSSLPAKIKDTMGVSAVTVGSKMFIGGGNARLCLSYCSDGDVWSILKKTIRQHIYGSAAYVKDRIVVCGGDNAGKQEDTIEIYDISKARWKRCEFKLPMPLTFLFCYSI